MRVRWIVEDLMMMASNGQTFCEASLSGRTSRYRTVPCAEGVGLAYYYIGQGPSIATLLVVISWDPLTPYGV